MLINTQEYKQIVNDVCVQIQFAQQQAVAGINRAMINQYWLVGQIINKYNSWGKAFIENLARDIKNAFPNLRGFSERNLRYMSKFADTYKKLDISATPLQNLSWRHNILLMERLDEDKQRIWYAEQALENGWSNSILDMQIDRELYKRQVISDKTTNFKENLPPLQSDMAQQSMKDPYIFEYEQNGEDRAKYGEKLLEEIALKLKEKGVLGMGERYLRIYRTFYLKYPQIQRVLPDYPIRKTLFSKLQTTDLSLTIQTDELIENNILNPGFLLSKLNFTHFIELIRVADPTERLFYEVEAIKNNWSIRELKRAINTSLALRTTLSINKESLIAKIKNLKPENSAEIIRNPYIIEFLGLEEKYEYSETDLEQSILNNLQKFLMELGSGFCFEARQKRITFNNRHYRIDLVFYHKILKCNVLLDLKTGEFDHADAGQMNMYLNYYRKNEMCEGDNPPIGIILCADKDDALVEYAIEGMSDMFVSKYMLQLPDKKVLENFIRNNSFDKQRKLI